MVPALTWELPVGSCVSLPCRCFCCVLAYWFLPSLTFQHYKKTPTSSVYSLGNPLSQGFYFLSSKSHIRCQEQGVGPAHCYWGGLYSRPSWKMESGIVYVLIQAHAALINVRLSAPNTHPSVPAHTFVCEVESGFTSCLQISSGTTCISPDFPPTYLQHAAWKGSLSVLQSQFVCQ